MNKDNDFLDDEFEDEIDGYLALKFSQLKENTPKTITVVNDESMDEDIMRFDWESPCVTYRIT